MTITLRVAGTPTGSVAVTAVTPTVGAGAVAGDLSLLSVAVKPYSSTVTTPSGWTKIGEATSGATASGTDVGSTKVALYYKIGALAGETTGNIAQTGANSMCAAITTYYSSVGASYDLTGYGFGAQDTPAATYLATSDTVIPMTAGDEVYAATAICTDNGTRSAAVFGGMAGATQAGATGLGSGGSNTGDDVGLYVRDVEITAGSSSGAPTFGFSCTASVGGVTAFLRIRETTNFSGGSDALAVTVTSTTDGIRPTTSASTTLAVTAAFSATKTISAGVSSSSDAMPVLVSFGTNGAVALTSASTRLDVTAGRSSDGTTSDVATLTGPPAVEPGEIISLTLTGIGTVTSYDIVQLSGPDVALAGAGAHSAGRAPFVMPDPDDAAAMAVFRGTVTTTTGTTTADYAVEIYPHTIWRRVGDHLEPVLIPVTVTSTSDAVLPSTQVIATLTMSAEGIVGVVRASTTLAVTSFRSSDGYVTAPARFTHPGVLVSQDMLVNTAGNITLDPWKTRWATLLSRTNDQDSAYNVGVAYSSLSWVQHPTASPTSANASSGRMQAITDGMAAWIDTLAFVYIGDRQRGAKAVQILNDWMHTIVSIPFNANNSPAGTSDGKLLAGWTAELFTRSAEVLRYLWNPTVTGSEPLLDVTTCIDRFTNIWWPSIYQGWTNGGANWMTSMLDGAMGIAVFCDDATMFATCLDHWRSWCTAYATRTGDSNKYAANYPHGAAHTTWDAPGFNTATFANQEWDSPYVSVPWPGALWSETGRDPWHSAMGFGALINAAETAWHQGVDLYGEQGGRLIPVMEKLARIVVGSQLDGHYRVGDTPTEYAAVWNTAISLSANNSQRATFEAVYNHYVNRMGASMPSTLDMLTRYSRTGNYIANLHLTGEAVTHRQNAAGRTYGNTMPLGDEAGWHQVTAVDFTTPVPIGGFVPNSSGVLTTAGMAGYTAYGPGRPGGALLEMYPNGWHSTDESGLYAPTQVVSVLTDVQGANGVLDYYCHTVTYGAETLPGSAVVHPISANANPRRIGPYFKYGFRMRTVGFNGTGYRIVPLTIDSAHWPDYGELDWPESDCNDGSFINGWYHRADPAGSKEAIPNDGGRNRVSDWHEYWVECTPGQVKFTLDDTVMLTSTTMVPSQPLYLVLQCEATTGTSQATSGHVQFDWVVAYDRVA